MNFVFFTLIAIITFILTTTGAMQIVGILLYLIPRKQYNALFGLILWVLILIGLYFAISKWFIEYFNVYLIASIISVIIALLNVKNFKK